MSVVVALVLTTGVFLVYDWCTTRPARRAEPTRRDRIERWLAEGGLAMVSPPQFVAACLVSAVGAFGFVLVVLAAPAVAMMSAIAGGAAPVVYYRARRRSLRGSRRTAWPDAVELLAGAVRAGDTLPVALNVVAERGPLALRPAFQAVVNDHRVSGDVAGALARLAATLADPVADRVLATLVLAHRVGGRELGRVLRTLGAFLREDYAVRREIEARQSWTLVAARVAAAAPWLVLLLVATRPQGAAAYSTFAGFVVLACGAGVTIVGYRAMLALARLPEEPRVLTRGPRPGPVHAAAQAGS